LVIPFSQTLKSTVSAFAEEATKSPIAAKANVITRRFIFIEYASKWDAG
jgi:hypothetical protein